MSRTSELLKRAKNKPGVSNSKEHRPIFIDKETAQELKEYCATVGLTMKEVTSALIQDFLDEQQYTETKK